MNEPFDKDPSGPLGAPAPDVPASDSPEPDALPAPLPRRFYPVAFALGLLAWCVIVAWVGIQTLLPRSAEETNAEATANETLHLLLMRQQARLLLGLRMFGAAGQTDLQIKTLNVGPVDQRLRYVVLVGEMQGPGEALAALEELDGLLKREKATLTAKQEVQRKILLSLYSDYRHLRYDAPSVTEPERLLLREDLGWFGDLALAPAGQLPIGDRVVALAGGPAAAGVPVFSPDIAARKAVMWPAQRVTATFLAVIAMGTFFLFLGFCGLVIIAVVLFLGKLRGGLRCGESPAGVYAETFAIWMTVFFGGHHLAVQYLPANSFRLMIAGLLEVLTLGVLVWPTWRGVPWSKVREDLGLTLGRRGIAEPVIGVGCYILNYPLLAIGIVITLMLTLAQQYLVGAPSPDDLVNPPIPAHPIMVPLARGDWGLRLQVFFLASIVAPLVEETMFRGVFYRHLRELTRRFTAVGSIICSVLVSSLIFAAIHPQGVLGIPLLMALGAGFALIREWRWTLVPAMVAHGLSNGLVLLLNIGTLAD